MRIDIFVAGSGGQGILLFGTTITYAASLENKNALCLPSYGAEARGGTVNCSVVFSDTEIKSPIPEQPDYLIFFNRASVIRFQQYIRPGVTLLYNSSEMDPPAVPGGVKVIGAPLEDLVATLDRRSVNMAMLGVFLELTHIMDSRSMETSLGGVAKDKGSSFVTLNLQAIEAGRRWVQEQQVSLSPSHHS
jgi:2-oxoglutarate ferredoxin oxidoreductase subunit gamma